MTKGEPPRPLSFPRKNVTPADSKPGESSDTGIAVHKCSEMMNLRLLAESIALKVQRDQEDYSFVVGIALCLLSAPVAALAETLDREVAEWVIRMGGNVVTMGPQPRVLSDLSDLPQKDFRIHTVNLVGANINPPDLVRLAELTHLKALYLPGPIFNPNAGRHPDHNPHMRHLAKLTDLEVLQLSDHFITTIKLRDSGLEQIASSDQFAGTPARPDRSQRQGAGSISQAAVS